MCAAFRHDMTEHVTTVTDGLGTPLPFLRVPEPYPSRSLDEVFAVARFLQDFPGQWWIGGGWAIDIWAGAPSREHEDIEICVLRSDQKALQAYCADWQFLTPVNDQWAPMADGEQLEFPRTMWQLRRTPETKAPDEMPPEFEFILNDVTNGEWLYQYNRDIHLQMERIISRSPLGLLVTAPEIVLLHKGWWTHRQKDDHDFQRVRHLLTTTQRAWLHEQLQAHQPDNPWLMGLI
jgi:hypothetical protein